MAEFCLECWNEINGTTYDAKRYIRSFEKEFCEGCGEYKRIIIAERRGLEKPFEFIISLIIDYIESKN